MFRHVNGKMLFFYSEKSGKLPSLAVFCQVFGKCGPDARPVVKCMREPQGLWYFRKGKFFLVSLNFFPRVHNGANDSQRTPINFF